MTWLVLFLALWLMLFYPSATVLIFSKRDDEAVYLLRDRLKEMYKRLPVWMQARRILIDNDHEFMLSNGSVARCFPTTAGDSYTATLAIVDEADLVPDLGRLLNSVKPTIDGGGRLVLLSRSDKSKPQSEFKNIYRAAKARLNSYLAIFLPWYARPGRDAAWYEAQRNDSLARTGSLDDLHEQYPATDTEALDARSLDKRIAPEWLSQCYQEAEGVVPGYAPAIPGLVIYKAPRPDGQYVIGADPAEGNPTSDDSALVVLDSMSGEEVAKLRGKFQPSVLAAHADTVGTYYNNAGVLPERNNHGHGVILWLQDNSRLAILAGHDGNPGWMSSTKGKALLYDTCADAFRQRDTLLHSFDVRTQLASIEGSTLRAPEGELDDLADAYSLALCARTAGYATGGAAVGVNPMADYRG